MMKRYWQLYLPFTSLSISVFFMCFSSISHHIFFGFQYSAQPQTLYCFLFPLIRITLIHGPHRTCSWGKQIGRLLVCASITQHNTRLCPDEVSITLRHRAALSVPLSPPSSSSSIPGSFYGFPSVLIQPYLFSACWSLSVAGGNWLPC